MELVDDVGWVDQDGEYKIKRPKAATIVAWPTAKVPSRIILCAAYDFWIECCFCENCTYLVIIIGFRYNQTFTGSGKEFVEAGYQTETDICKRLKIAFTVSTQSGQNCLYEINTLVVNWLFHSELTSKLPRMPSLLLRRMFPQETDL